LVFYATAYIPEYRSLLIGLTQSLSMAAGFVATNTVSYFLNFYSWQSIFQSVSMILAILSACIFLVLNDKPVKIQQTDPPPLHKTISIYSYKETWANALYAGFLYSPMMILSEGGLGVQMLHSIHELPESSIAFAISMSFIGRMIGGPLYGALLKTYTCLQIMRFSSLATFTVLPIIIYFPMSVSFLSLSLFMFGLSNAGTIGCYVIASEQHGLKNSSIVIGFTSMMSMLIGSVLIGSLPAILEYSAQAIIINDLPYYLAQDYQSIFGITMIFFTLASYFLTIAIKHPIKSIKKSP
jgi:MFS family permease